MSATNPWYRKIYSHDPYAEFPLRRSRDPFGWHHLDDIFRELIEGERPTIVIEVGAFKGGSTINMAGLMKRAEIPDATILTVDTWLGAWGHWEVENHEAHDIMQWEHGEPTIYETFLTNVILEGHEDIILPIRQTSSNGVRILNFHGIKADLCYVDGSHEYADVVNDLRDYCELLNPGRVMFGDDWQYVEVRRAVEEFMRDNRVDGFNVRNDNHWLFRKPV